MAAKRKGSRPSKTHRPADPKPAGLWMGLYKRSQRRILAGLLLVVPLAVTVFAGKFIYDLIEAPTAPLLDHLGALLRLLRSAEHPLISEYIGPLIESLPGIKVVVTVLLALGLLYFLGFISTVFFVRKIYNTGERLLLRIPLLKNIYGLSKQIVDILSREDKASFKQVVLIEYPRKHSYAFAFITGSCQVEGLDAKHLNLFVPTTPNPTSGFLLILPATDIKIVDMTIEDAFKMIMSAGVIAPEQLPVRNYKDPKIASPGEAEDPKSLSGVDSPA